MLRMRYREFKQRVTDKRINMLTENEQSHGVGEAKTRVERLPKQRALVHTSDTRLKSQKGYALREKGRTEIEQLSQNQSDLLIFYLLFKRKLNLP